MTIDAHQHLWRYEADDYPWIGVGMDRIAGDFLAADLEAVARPAGVEGSVAVQARQSLAESRWLLDLAATHPFIRGVVGWVDLRQEAVHDDLAALARHAAFKGVRHVVQDEADPRFLLGEAFGRGLAQLRAFGLVYDLLLHPAQLPAAVELVSRMPEQPFVLDHLAKPRIAAGATGAAFDAWRRDLERLARHGQVSCKLSGLVTEAAWGGWRQADFTPFLEVAVAAFGPHRCMFGSDWPVCLLSASYAEAAGIVGDFCGRLAPDERDAIMGGTATSVYRLEPASRGDTPEEM